jgi:hypothetical protein
VITVVVTPWGDVVLVSLTTVDDEDDEDDPPPPEPPRPPAPPAPLAPPAPPAPPAWAPWLPWGCPADCPEEGAGCSWLFGELKLACEEFTLVMDIGCSHVVNGSPAPNYLGCQAFRLT